MSRSNGQSSQRGTRQGPWRWTAGLWTVTLAFLVVGLARSAQVGIPFRDPGGRFLLHRVLVTVGVTAALIVLDGLWRTRHPLTTARVWDSVRTRWTSQRLTLAVSALAAYHVTYFVYHNLKSWNDLRPPQDRLLAGWDHALLLGHSPAALLHDLLGQQLAAWVLTGWYEAFGTLVVLAFPAAVVLPRRMSHAHVGIAAFVWVWILGTATYYLIPSIGPFHVAPGDFAGLPHTIVQSTQARYVHERALLLAHPDAPGTFAQLAAFASLHVGVSAVILGLAWWHRLRRTTLALGVFLVGTMVATVYLGWHFAVDVPAGLAIGAIAWWLAPRTVGVRRRPSPWSAAEAAGRGVAAHWAGVRFVASWALAIGVVAVILPRLVDVHTLLGILGGVRLSEVLLLTVVWLLGLLTHTFVLTAAAPDLSHRRALTLNLTGSAVSNLVPLGGAAGMELNRRMMRAWGIDMRSFTGYTFLTNLWDVGSKLLLPVAGVAALAQAGSSIGPQLRDLSVVGGVAFMALVVVTVLVLTERGTAAMGGALERLVHGVLRLVGRDRPLRLAESLDAVRRESADRVVRGWLRMTAGITGYVALQWALLALCLHVTGAGSAWPEVLAAFAVERALTVIPITPGGIGVADLGLVGVLLTFGGDPAGVAAAAVLYRLFTFVLEIPVGGGVLAVWVLAHGRQGGRDLVGTREALPVRAAARVAHVSDVFLPRLGGIETHVDDLVRHQRAAGVDAHVLTPTRGAGDDPEWVLRLSARDARAAVIGYDRVHVHVSVWSPYGIVVARAAMGAGIPTLVTVHSMWASAGGLLRLVGRTPLRRWPVVWSAVSGVAADAFRRSLGDAEVAVLPNAIDVAAWRPDGATAGPEDGSVTLVSVMRLVGRKRPLHLLEAFARVRRLLPDVDVRLVVVGDGPMRARMERRIRARGLTGSVRITGRLPRTEVLAELRAASLYVAPATQEAFGIAALEARAAGLPVVADRRGGVGEFVRDGVDGRLVDGDAGMVAALTQLVADPPLRERISKHNRLVPPAHDWPDALEVTEALYVAAAARIVPPVADAAPVSTSFAVAVEQVGDRA